MVLFALTNVLNTSFSTPISSSLIRNSVTSKQNSFYCKHFHKIFHQYHSNVYPSLMLLKTFLMQYCICLILVLYTLINDRWYSPDVNMYFIIPIIRNKAIQGAGNELEWMMQCQPNTVLVIFWRVVFNSLRLFRSHYNRDQKQLPFHKPKSTTARPYML